MSASPLGNFINTGANAIVRGVVLSASLGSASCGLELVMKTFREGFKWIGFRGDNKMYQAVTDRIPEVAAKIYQPLKACSAKEVATALFCFTVITAVGTEITNKLCGQAPSYYNSVGKWFSSLELNTKYRHPLIQMVVNVYNKEPVRKDVF